MAKLRAQTAGMYERHAAEEAAEATSVEDAHREASMKIANSAPSRSEHIAKEMVADAREKAEAKRDAEREANE